MEAFRAWLAENGARLIREDLTNDGGRQQVYTTYSVRGKSVLVHVSKEDGLVEMVEVYVPANPANDWEATLGSLRAYVAGP